MRENCSFSVFQKLTTLFCVNFSIKCNKTLFYFRAFILFLSNAYIFVLNMKIDAKLNYFVNYVQIFGSILNFSTTLFIQITVVCNRKKLNKFSAKLNLLKIDNWIYIYELIFIFVLLFLTFYAALVYSGSILATFALVLKEITINLANLIFLNQILEIIALIHEKKQNGEDLDEIVKLHHEVNSSIKLLNKIYGIVNVILVCKCYFWVIFDLVNFYESIVNNHSVQKQISFFLWGVINGIPVVFACFVCEKLRNERKLLNLFFVTCSIRQNNTQIFSKIMKLRGYNHEITAILFQMEVKFLFIMLGSFLKVIILYNQYNISQNFCKK